MTKKQPTRKAIISTRIIIATLALIAALVIFFFVRSIADKRTLLDNGEQATGTVQAHDVDVTTSRGGSLTNRKITYSFTPKGSGEKVTKEDFSVSRKEYEKYPTGSQIQITYLPSNPSMNQPSVSLRHMPSLAVPFIYLFLTIAVLVSCSKLIKNLQTKYGIKSPSWSFYFTSLGGFMAACFAAVGLTALVSGLISLILF
jgi:hypothetical protein